MDKRNPVALEAVTKALYTLAEVQLTTRMLDARLNDASGAQAAEDGQGFGSQAVGRA